MLDHSDHLLFSWRFPYLAFGLIQTDGGLVRKDHLVPVQSRASWALTKLVCFVCFVCSVCYALRWANAVNEAAFGKSISIVLTCLPHLPILINDRRDRRNRPAQTSHFNAQRARDGRLSFYPLQAIHLMTFLEQRPRHWWTKFSVRFVQSTPHCPLTNLGTFPPQLVLDVAAGDEHLLISEWKNLFIRFWRRCPRTTLTTCIT